MRSSLMRGERGFVLPTSLMVTTLLTVMLTAAFILVSAEHRTTDNSLASARALALAQAGLQGYFAQNRNLSGTSTYDSLRFTYSTGYADVVARRLAPPSGNALAVWVVRSSGYATEARLGGQTQGRRVVAQLAQLNPGILPARAAMVTANGVEVRGTGSNPLSGDDLGPIGACTPPAGAAADTFAVSAPDGEYRQPGGGTFPVGEGVNGVEELVDEFALIDSTHIDWAGLLAGNFVPDYTIPGAPWPPIGSNNYLVGYALGDVTIPAGQRRGLLVVQGNVTMADGAHWDGIIVAGGTLVGETTTANYIIDGMVVTGLNLSQGLGVPRSQVQRGGSRRIRWTWCYTQSSINSLSSLVPIRNGWVDTWSTY